MADGSVPMSEKNTGWSRERVDLVKRTICPRGISDDEFSLFIEQCKRSGLDPLLKEAFCVARRQNIGNKERPNWVTKHEFQPSEAGMLARAERFADYRGIQASAVFAEDEILMDQGKGEVVHRFNPAKRKGALVGAWARVVREQMLPVVVWLDFAGYVQQSPLWAKIPTTMIEKCARVAALRKAYPEAFGGLYVREELPAEEYPEEQQVGAVTVETTARTGPVAPAANAPALPTKTATREAAEVTTAGMGLDPQQQPVTAELRTAREPVAEKRSTPVPAALVAFGPHKGKPVAELSDDELSGTIDLAHEKLLEQPRARWAKAMRENLGALEAETEVRCRPESPEPGAGG